MSLISPTAYRALAAVLLACVEIQVAAGSSAGLVSSGFVARCSEPHGPSLEYGWHHDARGEVLESPANGFREGTDGFSNMEPVFIYEPDKPNVLLSLWGDTRPEAVSPEVLEQLARTSLDRNVVIARSPSAISAVYRSGSEVWLSTLYPSLGVGYFSYHEALSDTFAPQSDPPRLSARSSALKSECEFSPLSG